MIPFILTIRSSLLSARKVAEYRLQLKRAWKIEFTLFLSCFRCPKIQDTIDQHTNNHVRSVQQRRSCSHVDNTYSLSHSPSSSASTSDSFPPISLLTLRLSKSSLSLSSLLSRLRLLSRASASGGLLLSSSSSSSSSSQWALGSFPSRKTPGICPD